MKDFRLTGDAAAALADHRVQGLSIVPGSLFLELAQCVERGFRGVSAGVLCDASFDRPILLAEDCSIRVEAKELDGGLAEYRFYETGAPQHQGPAARLRVDRVRQATLHSVPDGFSVEMFRAQCDSVIDGERLYATLAANGNDYGPRYQRISTVWRSGRQCLAKVSAARSGALDPQGLPPSVLDALVQSLAAMLSDHGKTCVLRSIGKIEVANGNLPETLWAYAVLDDAADGARRLVGDVQAFDSSGRPWMRLAGVAFTLVDRADKVAAGTRVVVAANFTAEPVEDALKFWASHFDEPIELEFAPYDQVFPQLLDPASAFRRNPDGLDVVLLRLEPWATKERPVHLKASADRMERCFAGKPRCTLPNGLQVVHWNRYETEYLYKEIFEDRCYLRHGIGLPEDATVIDVGANIGLFSLFVMSRCRNATIYAFEPAPAIFELLKANCEAYGGRVRPVNAGVSDQAGTATFTFYENSSAFSGFHADERTDGAAIRTIVRNTLRDATALDGDSVEQRVAELTTDRLRRTVHECRLTSLSDFLRETGVQKVDLLKVDAEKSELDILRGIDDGDWQKIDQIVLEIHDPSAQAVKRVELLLAQKGYRCTVERERLLEGSGLFNLYATRAEMPAGREAPEPYHGGLQRNVEDFCTALATFRRESSTPLLLCVCPRTPGALEDQELSAALDEAERKLLEQAGRIPNVQTIGSACLLKRYPVADSYDPQGHQLGDIPYTPQGYAAIGTAIYRAMHGAKQAPFKVIALDCDNTLWKGTVGEDGVDGIEVSAPYRALQEFMVAQARNGMLICLCSKNNQQDVLDVFEQRHDMVLQREHLAAWRINWSSKSNNLTELAEELRVGLDSFLFLDDNPVDCADVRSQCPEVLVLQLPQASEALPAFLEHAWALDRTAATDEDRNRTRLYRENAERDRFRGRAASLREFLDGLELRIEIAGATEDQLPRVSQLTYRTNQFNFSTVRRSEEEIRRFLERGTCLTVRVADRFGDYGLVGVVLYEAADNRYKVDTFLLSCRILGRGVEHSVLARLAQDALENRKRWIELDFRRSEKNAPALEFLRSLGEPDRGDATGSWAFAAERLAQLVYDPDANAKRLEEAPEIDAHDRAVRGMAPRSRIRDRCRPLQSVAESLCDIDRIAKAIGDFHLGGSELQAIPAAGPEAALLNIWQRVLGRPRVGVQDNFFDVGGTSLKAVQVIAMIRKELNRDVSIVNLFEHPTVALLAAQLTTTDAAEAPSSRGDAALRGRKRRSAMTGEAA